MNHPKDGTSETLYSVGDTSVGDALSRHPITLLTKPMKENLSKIAAKKILETLWKYGHRDDGKWLSKGCSVMCRVILYINHSFEAGIPKKLNVCIFTSLFIPTNRLGQPQKGGSALKFVYTGVTKRCRLSLLTNSALVYESKCGLRGLSQWAQLCTSRDMEPK